MDIFRQAFRLRWLPALCLLSMGLVPASAQLLGPEFAVNSYTTSHQQYPAVAADSLGNFVVVWASQGQDDPSFAGIFGQRYDAAGAPLGGEFLVNSYTTQIQSKPAVTFDGTGKFVVVWESNGQDGSNLGIFGQRYDVAGTPLGIEFQINSYTTQGQQTPAVAADAAGDFVVVWQSYGQEGGLNLGVFGRRYNTAGVPQGVEFLVNSYTTGWQRDPSVAMNAAGDFVIAWQSYPQDGSLYGIFGRQFSAGGAGGVEFPVNALTTNNQVVPAVSADSVGNFVVVWEDKALDGSDYGIFGQRFSSAGATLGGEFQVNTETFAYQRNPTIAANGAGEFLVTWHSADQDGSLTGVFGQRFHSTGSPAAGEFQLNSYTTDRQQLPAVAADGQGRFVVAWRSDLQDGSSYGVFGRRVAALLFADGLESADACAWSAAVGGGC